MYSGSGYRVLRTSSSSWPMILVMPTYRATGAPISHAEHRWPGGEGRAVPAGLRKLSGLFRNAHRVDHRPLPVPAAHRVGGAVGRPRCRSATGPSHVAVVVEESRLRNDSGRKVASGRAPEIWSSQSGYDHFYGFRGGAVDYYTHANQKDDLWDDDVQVHQMGYLTDMLGSRAVDVVNGYAKSGRPFLISLHFNAPHWPWEAPGDEAESNRLAQRAVCLISTAARRRPISA